MEPPPTNASFQTVSMAPVPTAQSPPAPAVAPVAGAAAGAPAAEGSGLRLVSMLQTAAHPVTCVFHAAFKVVVLLCYITGRYVSGNYVSTFILSTVFAALDFWTVKNITGRLLVGLRWWNHIREDGSSEWVFESNPEESALNATDRNVFWLFVYVWPVLWAFFLIMNLLSFSFAWVLLNTMVLVFAGSNLAGYWKCSKDAKKRAREWVESQGIRAVAGAMGF